MSIYLQYSYKQYLISIGVMQLFVIFSTYFPEYFFYFFITYTILMTVVLVIYVGRRAKPLIKDLETVMQGRAIYKVKREELQEIMLKDPEYLEVMRKKLKVGVIQWVFFMISLAIFLTPYLREGLRYGITTMLLHSLKGKQIPYILGGVEKLSLLVSYELLYMSFMLIALMMSRIAKILMRDRVGVIIPNTYTLTDRGIVIDNRIPLKFPIEIINYRIKRRKYLEIELKEQIGREFMQPTRRIRFYSKSPGKLWTLIRDLCNVSSSE